MLIKDHAQDQKEVILRDHLRKVLNPTWPNHQAVAVDQVVQKQGH